MAKKTSRLEQEIRWREWRRMERFPGAIRWRPVTSEIHLMSTLSVVKRRERIKNSLKTIFRFRLRGQHFGSLIFDN